MRYLLDSDSLSDLYAPGSPGHLNISRRVAALGDSDLVLISILALFELEYGYANAPEDKKPVIRQRISDASTNFRFFRSRPRPPACSVLSRLASQQPAS